MVPRGGDHAVERPRAPEELRLADGAGDHDTRVLVPFCVLVCKLCVGVQVSQSYDTYRLHHALHFANLIHESRTNFLLLVQSNHVLLL